MKLIVKPNNTTISLNVKSIKKLNNFDDKTLSDVIVISTNTMLDTARVLGIYYTIHKIEPSLVYIDKSFKDDIVSIEI